MKRRRTIGQAASCACQLCNYDECGIDRTYTVRSARHRGLVGAFVRSIWFLICLELPLHPLYWFLKLNTDISNSYGALAKQTSIARSVMGAFIARASISRCAVFWIDVTGVG